ncbi:hypothetical protein CJD_A0363, partial [Clostridium perfringens D str. JGS1721]
MAKKENLIKKMIKRKLKKKILAFLLSSTGLAIAQRQLCLLLF